MGEIVNNATKLGGKLMWKWLSKKEDVDGVMMSLGSSEIWTFHINVERGR